MGWTFVPLFRFNGAAVGQTARSDHNGRHAAGLAGLAIVFVAAVFPASPAFAQSASSETASAEAVPLPPSSFDLRRQELIKREARRQAAVKAARESRQRRLAGKGRAKPPDQPTPGAGIVDGLLSPKTAFNVSIAAIMATAAISAISDDSRNLANASGGSDNAGGDAGGGGSDGSTTTSTSTTTN